MNATRNATRMYVTRWATDCRANVGGLLSLTIGALLVAVAGIGFVQAVAVSSTQTTEENRYICYSGRQGAITNGSYCQRDAANTEFSSATIRGKTFTLLDEIAPQPDGTASPAVAGDAGTTFTTNAGSGPPRRGARRWAVWAPGSDPQTRGLTALLPLLFVVILIAIMVGVFKITPYVRGY